MVQKISNLSSFIKKTRGWTRWYKSIAFVGLSTHICLIDSVLNYVLCIVTRCLHLTPMDHLPILSGIHPTEFHQLEMTLSLAYCRSLDPDHCLQSILSGFSDTHLERPRSSFQFVTVAHNLLNNLARLGICTSQLQMEHRVL